MCSAESLQYGEWVSELEPHTNISQNERKKEQMKEGIFFTSHPLGGILEIVAHTRHPIYFIYLLFYTHSYILLILDEGEKPEDLEKTLVAWENNIRNKLSSHITVADPGNKPGS